MVKHLSASSEQPIICNLQFYKASQYSISLTMRTIFFCITTLFAVLLAMTSCEKIDADDLNTSGNKNTVSDSKDTSDNTSDNTDSNDGSIPAIPLQELPDGTLLFPSDAHATAITTATDDGNKNVLLISLHEWNGIILSDGASSGAKVVQMATKYREGNLTGWRIPTKDEAKQLRETLYGYKEGSANYLSKELETLNEQITSFGGKPLRAWQIKTSSPAYRYLCNNAEHSFSLLKSTNITVIGTKTEYNLRLVKDTIIANQ